MNKKPHQYRQGDVLIVPIETDKRGKDIREKTRIVLAHGEVTGHAHVVTEPKGCRVDFEEIESGTDALAGARILRVAGKSALLRHDEHSEIEIPVGVYRIARQREYSPEAIRPVQD